MKAHFFAILNSYSELLFLQGLPLGAVMFALLLLRPGMAAAGMLAVVAAYAFARLINLEKEFLSTGYYTYNPLLVGLALGSLFQFSPLTAFLVCSAGVLTLVVTISLANLFSTYLGLPILSVPFVLVSSLSYLASLRYSNLFVVGSREQPLPMPFDLPGWLSGFLKSLGAILFSPDSVTGLLLLLLIFCRSRILTLLAVIGYGTGTLIRGLLLGSSVQAFADINSFNFILIAMALGGVFLIPSPRSYGLAVIAVVISTILLDATMVFWSSYGIPAFTLPFNMISLTMIYVLGLLGSPLIARYIKKTPEETLDQHLSMKARYTGSDRILALPFAGKWTVWQGFNGRWTHKGNWKYAYDFVITGTDGETFRGAGTELKDYHAYRKPVLSPVRGRIINIVSDLPDNNVGDVDRINNWGNAIVIHDPRGFHVELSHLAQNSVAVKQGDWVERGTFLGLCGNSGHSPQPHIHVQVQAEERLGARTLPFSFASYTDGEHHHANATPEENDRIEPLSIDRHLDRLTCFILDQQFDFQVKRHGKNAEFLRLTVRMSPAGSYYLDSDDGKLFFGKHEGTFYFQSLEGNDDRLQLIFKAMSRIPLVHRDGLAWHDFVPAGVASSGVRCEAARFLGSFHPPFAEVRTHSRFLSKNKFETQVESAFLDLDEKIEVTLGDKPGMYRIWSEELELRRIEIEEA